MNRIRLLFGNVINIGIQPGLVNSEQKKIRLLNIVCLVSIANSLLFLSLGLIDLLSANSSYPNQASDYVLVDMIFADLIMIFIPSITILLQFLNKQKLARWIFVISISIRACLFVLYVNPGEHQEYGLVQIPLIATLLLSSLWSQLIFLIASIIIAFVATLEVAYYPNGEGLDPFTVSIFFVAIFVTVRYLIKLNEKSERLLLIEKENAIKDTLIIRKQREELKQLNDFKDHFFVNISHELKTPITLINGYVEKLDDSRYREKGIQIIKEEARDMQMLVENILDLSKLEDSSFKLKTEKLIINELLEELYLEFRPLFAQEEINFHFQNASINFTIEADQQLIRRALANLLTNALKFTNKGGEVELSILQNKGVFISVYNTGIGIPQSDLENVFARFKQVDNSLSKSQGSGIGLAVTRDIVQQHGFTIKAESKEGDYARFTIKVPNDLVGFQSKYSQSKQDGRELVSQSFIPNSESHMTTKKTILLVDDHDNMREYIKTIQGLDQYNFLEASDGLKAKDLIKNTNVDLVLTDFMMPRMDGLDLVKFMRDLAIMTPVIVITAQSAINNKLSLLRLGIDGYLAKPFYEEELRILIHNALLAEATRQAFITELENNENTYSQEAELMQFNAKLNEIIQKGLTNSEFNIGVICEQMHMTERTLFRRVKELTGETPAKIIQEARLVRAKNYYDHQSFKSTRQLALSVGFTNSTRFAQKFEKRFGIQLNA